MWCIYGGCWCHTGDPADLSPAPDFIFLNLNWPIVKFVLEQIYFVPKYFLNYSNNTKNLFGNKKEQKIVIGFCAMV